MIKKAAKAAAPIVAPAQTAPAVEESNTVTNCIEGTELHLGDKRTLKYGESADVSAELAAQLRASGQAK